MNDIYRFRVNGKYIYGTVHNSVTKSDGKKVHSIKQMYTKTDNEGNITQFQDFKKRKSHYEEGIVIVADVTMKRAKKMVENFRYGMWEVSK